MAPRRGQLRMAQRSSTNVRVDGAAPHSTSTTHRVVAPAEMVRVCKMPDLKTTTTVYLVVNDPTERNATTRALMAEGFHVKTWSTADAFLAQYDPAEPGCLVSDITMPGTDG